jgi:hypothetical protein
MPGQACPLLHGVYLLLSAMRIPSGAGMIVGSKAGER